MQLMVNHEGGPERTVSEAIHGLQANGSVTGRPVKVHAQRALGMGFERGRAHGLTGLGATEVHDMASAGAAPGNRVAA